MKLYYKIENGEEIFFTGNVLKTVLEVNGQIKPVMIVNPTELMMLDAGWLIWIEPESPEPTEEELIETYRQRKLDEIISYDLSYNVNLFYLAGQPLWLDALTRLTLRISIESYQALGVQEVTKWFNGLEYTFPTSSWLLMLNALEVYAAEALNVTERHKYEVEALNTIEDIENYDITTGYPDKLNLSVDLMRGEKGGTD